MRINFKQQELIEELLEELEDAQAAREALEAYRAGETVPWEEVRAERARAGNAVPD